MDLKEIATFSACDGWQAAELRANRLVRKLTRMGFNPVRVNTSHNMGHYIVSIPEGESSRYEETLKRLAATREKRALRVEAQKEERHWERVRQAQGVI